MDGVAPKGKEKEAAAAKIQALTRSRRGSKPVRTSAEAKEEQGATAKERQRQPSTEAREEKEKEAAAAKIQALTRGRRGNKPVRTSAEAKEEQGATAKGGQEAREKEEAEAANAVEIHTGARETAAAALEVLTARAAAEKAVGVWRMEKAKEVKGAEGSEAKREGVGEATVTEPEEAQKVDEPNVLPDDLWSAGCAAYKVRVQCMCMSDCF